MNLLQATISQKKRRGGYEPEAVDYFAQIELANSSISTPNKDAINTFIKGCKTDGIWSAIKASCILAGSETLEGALVPLVGAAPINVNFQSADYNRVTGLKGNGTTKYLRSGRLNDDDPQDNKSISFWRSEAGIKTSAVFYCGGGGSTTGAMAIYAVNLSPYMYFRHNAQTGMISDIDDRTRLGFVGLTRNNSATFNSNVAGVTRTHTRASQTPVSNEIDIFRSSGFPSNVCDDRFSFYHIGEHLDLAQLNARLTTLMASIT
jgi:hypothetical protein